jgi:hypothetical protein
MLHRGDVVGADVRDKSAPEPLLELRYVLAMVGASESGKGGFRFEPSIGGVRKKRGTLTLCQTIAPHPKLASTLQFDLPRNGLVCGSEM